MRSATRALKNARFLRQISERTPPGGQKAARDLVQAVPLTALARLHVHRDPSSLVDDLQLKSVLQRVPAWRPQ